MIPPSPHHATSTVYDGLIGGVYGVEIDQPLPDFGAGQPCFVVTDHRHGRRNLMAVQVALNAPARPLPIISLSKQAIEGLLLPITHGRAPMGQGGNACFVVMPKPPGPPLWHGLAPPKAGQQFGEQEVLEGVLRPLARALAQLKAAGMTHRAIRPDNIFRAPNQYNATLGGAWAAPPAMLQPCVFEPPYSAQCHPAGRGDGSIADDVYALGVVLIALIGGVMPMAGVDDETIIRSKLERGSFAALTRHMRLPPSLADLFRLMLAEDPEHRPPPAVLADVSSIRSFRIAMRLAPRAQRPLEIGGTQVWDARNLAHALFRAPRAAIPLLRSNGLDLWLRRTLGEPALAARIDQIARSQANDPIIDRAVVDADLLMRTIAVLDPLAPLCWHGLALFPDGVGPLVAMLSADTPQAPQMEMLQAVVEEEACVTWGDAQIARLDMALLRMDCRQQRAIMRISGWAGGPLRLAYTLNPLLACRASLVRHEAILRLHDVMPALERAAPEAQDLLLDADMAAFISAKYNGSLERDFAILAQDEDPDIDPPGHRGVAQLRVLSRICAQDEVSRWLAVATVALRPASIALTQWRGRSARAERERALQDAADNGALARMVAVLSDTKALGIDWRNSVQFALELRTIEGETDRLQAAKDNRVARARTTGNEIAAAMGVMALAIAAIVTVVL